MSRLRTANRRRLRKEREWQDFLRYRRALKAQRAASIRFVGDMGRLRETLENMGVQLHAAVRDAVKRGELLRR